jgi:hypothetical protein
MIMAQAKAEQTILEGGTSHPNVHTTGKGGMMHEKQHLPGAAPQLWETEQCSSLDRKRQDVRCCDCSTASLP